MHKIALVGVTCSEDFLVTGLLCPLIVPATSPWWMFCLDIFGVVIGKEVFGGTGMNVFNPALVSRSFLFYAYTTSMSVEVWIKVPYNVYTGTLVANFWTSIPSNSVRIFIDGLRNAEIRFSGATPPAILSERQE